MNACLARLVARCLPKTLFGRLALLLFVAVLSSHVLALTVMFEFMPHPHGPPPGHPPMVHHANPVFEPQRPSPLPPPLMPANLLLDIGVRLSALMLAAWIGARWLSEPMKRLACAADELGRNIDRPPLPEDGTTECREASRVFNQMQAQIRQQLADRDRFVASVSHDLRTPLTRLRLRTEGLVNATQRMAFQRDVKEMDDMVAATLDYLATGADTEPFVLLDVTALIDTLTEDHRACGQPVGCEGRAAPMLAQVSALRRCVENLVENALRYGQQADIRLTDSATEVRIEVFDRGPGLAPEELTRVLAPFYRVEGSRNRAHGGVGLGLSIAHDVARRHGGNVVLRNRDAVEGGGLVASVVLPRHDSGTARYPGNLSVSEPAATDSFTSLPTIRRARLAPAST
jgi:signal transduction histidine kinase